MFDAHDRSLNRRVALKAHWPHLHAFPISTEAQALAAIDFIVMERIVGTTLADRITRSAPDSFPVAEATDLFARLADGLSAVHEAGIAHRDVKPANIMLAARDRLVLTDFGIFLPESSTRAPTTCRAPRGVPAQVSRGSAPLHTDFSPNVVIGTPIMFASETKRSLCAGPLPSTRSYLR